MLHRYLGRIDLPGLSFEEKLTQEVLAIKNLVNRKSYTMTGEQISLLHRKFKNLASYRNFRAIEHPDKP